MLCVFVFNFGKDKNGSSIKKIELIFIFWIFSFFKNVLPLLLSRTIANVNCEMLLYDKNENNDIIFSYFFTRSDNHKYFQY